jgi:predicted DNA-binding transcriptional regulator YafY
VSAGAADRLSRLLAMVPYLLERQGVPLADAARHFEITEDELVADLELLFVCGTPGHLPDDLIEADWESGHVYLDNADAIARPLRLGVDEAVALLVGLRTLADVPGVGDREALNGALAKLSAAAGDVAATAGAVRVQLEAGAPEGVLAAAREALTGRRRLHLRYLVPSRDETTERDVDPMRLTSVDGRWYLEAWCHRVDDVRLFRLDRVVEASVLDVDGTPPPRAVGRDLDDGLFQASPQDLLVTVELEPHATWVADYYPVETVEELPGDRRRVRMRTADPRWLRRLVLRLGGTARVTEPREVADDVRATAERALAAYR